jgi:superfamily I DNA/RNA helicase
MIKFLINEEPHGIEALDGKDLKITATKQTKPRSLDANAYFHVLCDKLRQKMNVSMASMKNHLITSYGQIEYVDEGKPAAIKSNVPFETMQEMETPHLKFVKMSEDGNYMYFLYRPSHTYNVEEMSRLIEGTVQECLNVGGIEVRTPDEIRRMEMLWNIKQQMKGEGHD